MILIDTNINSLQFIEISQWIQFVVIRDRLTEYLL